MNGARALVLLVALGAGLLLAGTRPGEASATPCEALFYDPQGFVWDLDRDGSVIDGSNDVFDGWGGLTVGTVAYPQVPDLSCSIVSGGREASYPGFVLDGLQVWRRAYVPAGGAGFLRWIEIIRNPNPFPVARQVTLTGNLGYDAATHIYASSNGDGAASPADAWAVTAESPPGFRTPAAHLWDGGLPGRADAADRLLADTAGDAVWANGKEVARFIWDGVLVPAGATVVYVHLEVQRGSVGDAAAAAAGLSAGPAEVFRGMSGGEIAAVRNWRVGDVDRDAVGDARDDCPTDPNRDQADLDRDGTGDACDGDLDGDGIANGDEAARGTSPHAADSDGDGVRDAQDRCPAVPGLGGNGCRATSGAAVSMSGLRSKVKRSAFLKKGVRPKVRTDRPAALTFELFAATSRATVSRSYNLLLARRRMGTGSGTRAATLVPSRRLIGRKRTFTVRVVITATDADGNTSSKTKTIKVR